MANLLLVDDDAVLLGLLAKLLRRSGHAVTTAGSGAEALALTAEQTFDLIITDVMMPDLDGYQLTRQLRSQPGTHDTLILIFTSRLQGPDADLAALAGSDGSMMKSVNVARLNAVIEEMLAGRITPASE
ncbi:MAG: response regulator [Anaerolineales bacterium]